MIIVLNQTDMEAALIGYIKSQGLNVTNQDIKIKISGRSDTGYNAELDLSPSEVPSMEPVPRSVAYEPEPDISQIDAALVEDSTTTETTTSMFTDDEDFEQESA